MDVVTKEQNAELIGLIRDAFINRKDYGVTNAGSYLNVDIYCFDRLVNIISGGARSACVFVHPEKKGELAIYVNNDFFTLDSKTEDAALGHEVAHIVLGHLPKPPMEIDWNTVEFAVAVDINIEKEADAYSVQVLHNDAAALRNFLLSCPDEILAYQCKWFSEERAQLVKNDASFQAFCQVMETRAAALATM